MAPRKFANSVHDLIIFHKLGTSGIADKLREFFSGEIFACKYLRLKRRSHQLVVSFELCKNVRIQ